MKINHFIPILLCLNILILPQTYISGDGIPRDSSYTVFGYYKKELAKFPFIKIAESENCSTLFKKYDYIYYTEGSRNLRLDLFYPDSKAGKPYPVIILLHGGGWKSGDKSFLHPLAERIACEGFLCAAVEYRLSPEAKYPAAVLDIKRAVKWLKLKAEEFRADSSDVILLGCSSGGHLAALCGVTEKIPFFNPVDFLPGISGRINLVIDIDGILDFTDPAESGKDTSDLYHSAGKLWLGESFKDNKKLWMEASPLTYISENSPSFLFINSSIDRFHAGRDSAVQLLRKYRIEYEIHTIPDTPHTFWLFEPWFTQTTDIIIDFLRKRIR